MLQIKQKQIIFSFSVISVQHGGYNGDAQSYDREV